MKQLIIQPNHYLPQPYDLPNRRWPIIVADCDAKLYLGNGTFYKIEFRMPFEWVFILTLLDEDGIVEENRSNMFYKNRYLEYEIVKAMYRLNCDSDARNLADFINAQVQPELEVGDYYGKDFNEAYRINREMLK